MLLAFLEYSALESGVAVRPDSDSLFWTATDAKQSFNFSVQLGSDVFALRAVAEDSDFSGFRNDQLLFRCSRNTRVVTDATGVVTGLIGVSTSNVSATLQVVGSSNVTQEVATNSRWQFDAASGKLSLLETVPFTLPFE